MKGSKESARSATQRANEKRLREAAASNDLETIRSLIVKKTNPNAQDEVCIPPELPFYLLLFRLLFCHLICA